MKDVTVYHNTRCSKSNECVRLLEEQGIDANIVLYLTEPLSDVELKKIVNGYAGALKELIRVNDAKKLAVLLPDNFDKNTVFELLKNTPQIMERPIVEKNGKFIVARPVEKINMIL